MGWGLADPRQRGQCGDCVSGPLWPCPAAPVHGHKVKAIPAAPGWSLLLVAQLSPSRRVASSGSEPAAQSSAGWEETGFFGKGKVHLCPSLGRSGTSGRSSGRSISRSASTPTSSVQ